MYKLKRLLKLLQNKMLVRALVSKVPTDYELEKLKKKLHIVERDHFQL